MRHPEPHPYLCAAILATDARTHVAKALGISDSKLHVWTKRTSVPAELLPRLAEVSAALIVERERELTARFLAMPIVICDRAYARAWDDLDRAYRLRFGRSIWEADA